MPTIRDTELLPAPLGPSIAITLDMVYPLFVAKGLQPPRLLQEHEDCVADEDEKPDRSLAAANPSGLPWVSTVETEEEDGERKKRI